MNKVLLKTGKNDWETPQDFFDKLNNDMLKGWHREETTCYSQVCSKKRKVLWMNFEPMGQMRIEDIPGVMP